jgi:EpsI family protein
MTTSRLAILLAVLLTGLGSIFLLPKQLGFQPVGVEMELPKMVGGWYGTDVAVTEKEKQVLGAGTEFARKSYRNGRGYEITASIVLSGQDMNTSIHRPERCLPAQGFTVIDKRSVPIALPDRPPLRVTRLQNVRNIPAGENAPTAFFNLTYYWFAGHTDVTNSHYARTWFDVRDRLLHGYNQRWAYLTVAATLPPGAKDDPRIERMVDEWMQDFIKQLLPKIEKKETLAAN